MINQKNNLALLQKPSGAVEKAAPGAKRILSSMVGDTLDLARKTTSKEVSIADTQLKKWFQTGEKYSSDRNWVEAAKWFRKAAEQNYAPAQNMLGYCYKNGWGVPEDFFEAVKWYHAAAEQNYAEAQYHLGGCYLFGDILKGIEKDLIKAVMWFRKAAEQNHAPAQSALGYRYYAGEGVEKDFVEAAKWFRMAAEQGHEVAQRWLTIPRDGIDIVESYKWTRVRADKPENDYEFVNLEYRKEHMTPEQIEKGEALAREFLSKSKQ